MYSHKLCAVHYLFFIPSYTAHFVCVTRISNPNFLIHFYEIFWCFKKFKKYLTLILCKFFLFKKHQVEHLNEWEKNYFHNYYNKKNNFSSIFCFEPSTMCAPCGIIVIGFFGISVHTKKRFLNVAVWNQGTF